MGNLVWVDCEMTGLSLVRDALIEVAALVTDKDLNVLGDGVDVVIKPPDEALAQMDAFVQEMHNHSGLMPELAHGVTLAEAEATVLAYIQQFVPEAGKAPLAGNTIGTDRSFLARDMPTLEKYLHYRNVDVSSVKELARRWFPAVVSCAPLKQGNHRALADIQESIEELRYFREVLFVPPPGPQRATLTAAAAKHAGSLTGLVGRGPKNGQSGDAEDHAGAAALGGDAAPGGDVALGGDAAPGGDVALGGDAAPGGDVALGG